MKKILLVVALFLFSISSIHAEALIEEQNRVLNFGPGYCCWCCLETIGNQRGITKLKDLAHNREKDPDFIDNGVVYKKNLGVPNAVAQKLNSLGVHYSITNFDRQALKNACANKGGAVAFMNSTPGTKEEYLKGTTTYWNGYHAILVTEYNDNNVCGVKAMIKSLAFLAFKAQTPSLSNNLTARYC